MEPWPATREELVARQLELAAARPPPWRPIGEVVVAGCFVCFPRGPSGPGAKGDLAWAAAATSTCSAVVEGRAGAPYEPGLLAFREGPLLEQAVRALSAAPDVLLVDATGRDHPRRAGLALHLGWVLDLPTIGVTHRPLLARGDWPDDARGATSALLLDDELVGYWLRTTRGTRPLAIHAAWRTDADTAAEIVRAYTGRTRTPEPLREARRLARTARASGPPTPAG